MMVTCRARRASEKTIPAFLMPLCEYCLKFEAEKEDPSVTFDSTKCIRLAQQFPSQHEQVPNTKDIPAPGHTITTLELHINEAMKDWIKALPYY